MTVALAMVLDALFGEPERVWSRIPHPAVLMGRMVGWADQRFNAGTARRLRGVGVMGALCVLAWGLGMVLGALGPVVEILVAAILLAQRALVDHVADVARALRLGVDEGRAAVARIVGRDTADMDGPAIARAAIESAAENLSDGVIAPLFWLMIGGLPGLLVYKITNTADSMIGYRTPRHKEFGWAAARFDDLLNLIPARLTALLIWLPRRQGRWRDITREARQHRSPNAGWPEAAMARHLNVALAGPRSYDGAMKPFPWVHGAGNRAPAAHDIFAATRALWQVWGIALVGVVVLTLLR